MAGRFPLYTDADAHGHVVKALKAAGWDVLRAIDAYPEGTKDPIHFEQAAREGRALVTNDRRMVTTANEWIAQGTAKGVSIAIGRAFRAEVFQQLRDQGWLPDSAECAHVSAVLQNSITSAYGFDPLDRGAPAVPLRCEGWVR